MISLYPPILESKAYAIPFRPDSIGNSYKIFFKMPDSNNLEDIRQGHIQVALKVSSTGLPAVNDIKSPDNTVIYLSGDTTLLKSIQDNYYSLSIPYDCFEGGLPQRDTTYSAQIRFGQHSLWTGFSGEGLGGTGWENFATWRKVQTSQVPSGFGEWSNIQTVYCHGAATIRANYGHKDFVPEISFSYNSQFEDRVSQTIVSYVYQGLNGIVRKSEVFDSEFFGESGYVLNTNLWIAPVVNIYVDIRCITENNVVWKSSLIIPPLVPTANTGWLETREPSLLEVDDGLLAMEYQISNPNGASIYRIDIYDLSVLEVYNIEPGTYSGTFRDYNVEMGREYQYVVFQNENNISDLFPFGLGSRGHGRLMKMEHTFLLDNQRQLRLSGNVNISQFKRNTSDSFQTTLGSKYPFYQRSAETNYKTFNLTGTLAAALDETSTFIKYDPENGLMWDDGLVVNNKDLVWPEDIIMNKERLKNNHHWQYQGPTTIFDEFEHRDIARLPLNNQDGRSIFVERQFREFATQWLSNGKPKIFRSETEGNMIVMLSNITLTPLAHSHRIVYNISAQVTEVAEFNTENLRKYNLILKNLEAYYGDNSGLQFNPGSKDPMNATKVKYDWSPKYDIPRLAPGQGPTTIETGSAVSRGIPPYTFSIVKELNFSGNRIDAIADLITMDPKTGTILIDRLPEDTSLLPTQGSMVLKVEDSSSQPINLRQDIMTIFFNGVGEKLEASWADFTNYATISDETIGEQIDYTINISGGTAPYAIYSDSLPTGLNVEMTSMNTASLYGTVESPNTLLEMTSTATIMDSSNQKAEVQLVVNEVIYPVEVFEKEITILSGDVGVEIIPIDLESKVRFGLFETTTLIPTPRYVFDFVDENDNITTSPIQGLQIIEGVLKGVPSVETEAGTARIRVKAENPGTLKDSYAYFWLHYGRIYDFRWRTPLLVRYPIGAGTEIDLGYVAGKHQILTDLEADPADFVFPYISGGEPPYRFTAKGLLPFKITKTGLLSGVASSTQESKIATITATDARQKETSVSVYVPAIRGILGLLGGAAYNLGNLVVGKAISVTTIKSNDFTNAEGGVRVIAVENLPAGLTVGTLPTAYDSNLVISGTPTQAKQPSEILVTVEDNSSPKKTAQLIIQVGIIHQKLTGISNINIEPMGYRQDLKPINLRDLVVGGSGDFVFRFYDINNIYPFILNKDGIIYGNSGNRSLASSYTTLYVKDLADGTEVNSRITRGTIRPLSFNYNYSVNTTGTFYPISSGKVNTDFSVKPGNYISGGTPPYRFIGYDTPNWININEETGELSGIRPSTPERGGNFILAVIDNRETTIFINIGYGDITP